MIYLRASSEDEIILEYLKGEINSERFRSQIIEVLGHLKVSIDIIEKADLKDRDENERRKDILRLFRGYGSNTHLFENFPIISKWIYAECSSDDMILRTYVI